MNVREVENERDRDFFLFRKIEREIERDFLFFESASGRFEPATPA